MGRVSDAKEKLMDAVLELLWTGSYGSTTVDLICEKAGVKKGSFYHFFDSKADLAAAALDAEFQVKRVELDALFSPTVPPLERLRKLCEVAYQRQAEAQKRFGRVLGCPLFTLGAEVSTLEATLRTRVEEILDHHARYIASAIREAHAAGLVDAPDAEGKARVLRAYYEGLLTQARINNNVEILRELAPGLFAILGAKEPKPAKGKR
jgi:TetR/AcrR family transcriptional regulator, transcriptional repressor for nem operon